MKIIDLNNYTERKYKTAVALGNFDGIHKGHKHLITNMVRSAKRRNLRSSILLFKNHTRDILGNNNIEKFNILTSNEQKLKIIEGLGVDIVYTMKFDRNIMRLTGKEFIEDIIIDKLNSQFITVGFDYKFGYKASGDSSYLKQIGLQKGLSIDIIEPIIADGEVISSTTIRGLIRDGNIRKANRFLGRNYMIEGRVIAGQNRGTGLGFPTANMKLSYNYVIPKSGVYKTYAIIGGRGYPCITSIGANPTFDDDEFKIETHILDFDQYIYDEGIQVELIDFIRENIRFNTVEDLKRQIEHDIESISQVAYKNIDNIEEV
ncbi:MAG: bifunctional riboflavin kinase/FAD synthetase [Tissierellia bacterium]|nr:bifunctional riboflavin kinase/FAD synthetase [Tissierellia bacterium]